MTIRLPEPLRSDIMSAVESGRYASFDNAMTAAASLLIERLRLEQAEEVERTRQAVAEMKAGAGGPAADMLADMRGSSTKSEAGDLPRHRHADRRSRGNGGGTLVGRAIAGRGPAMA